MKTNLKLKNEQLLSHATFVMCFLDKMPNKRVMSSYPPSAPLHGRQHGNLTQHTLLTMCFVFLNDWPAVGNTSQFSYCFNYKCPLTLQTWIKR